MAKKIPKEILEYYEEWSEGNTFNLTSTLSLLKILRD